jgi:hypothetical protein
MEIIVTLEWAELLEAYRAAAVDRGDGAVRRRNAKP